MFYVEERFHYNAHTPYFVFDNTHGEYHEHPVACFTLRADAENFAENRNKFCSIKDTKGYVDAYKKYKQEYPEGELAGHLSTPAHKCEECGEGMDSHWKVQGGKKIGGVCVRCERELCGECGGYDELGLCKRCVEIEDAEERKVYEEEDKNLIPRTRLEVAEWRHGVYLENEKNNKEKFGKVTAFKYAINEKGEEVRISAHVNEEVVCVHLKITGQPVLLIPIRFFSAVGEAFDVMRGGANEPLPVGWEEAE